MKKTWLITIKYLAPYPKEMSIRMEAANAGLAANRAFKEWKKQNKGVRVKEITFKAILL